tara:strand:- start:5810 stop:6085 length:276 start_codon:yes stop_codon:yes gene_type:complete
MKDWMTIKPSEKNYVYLFKMSEDITTISKATYQASHVIAIIGHIGISIIVILAGFGVLNKTWLLASGFLLLLVSILAIIPIFQKDDKILIE